ncbi:hypothetical protein P691DRAFT_782782 [Macrolepiota fuliginosa MF-IS2]|uniref:Uncharacterized protein n=1 Tax=Macrolepiota fuliginosa MF-IS2 TaxID=1400762 RepID=A0A9P6C3C5_9AGAR|nr:hypothetical protein P691DRAFT_782782 [Macrolepiota fuliginosa MF-IS2]
MWVNENTCRSDNSIDKELDSRQRDGGTLVEEKAQASRDWVSEWHNVNAPSIGAWWFYVKLPRRELENLSTDVVKFCVALVRDSPSALKSQVWSCHHRVENWCMDPVELWSRWWNEREWKRKETWTVLGDQPPSSATEISEDVENLPSFVKGLLESSREEDTQLDFSIFRPSPNQLPIYSPSPATSLHADHDILTSLGIPSVQHVMQYYGGETFRNNSVGNILLPSSVQSLNTGTAEQFWNLFETFPPVISERIAAVQKTSKQCWDLSIDAHVKSYKRALVPDHQQGAAASKGPLRCEIHVYNGPPGCLGSIFVSLVSDCGLDEPE